MTYREVAKKLASLDCRELPRTGIGSHRMWFNFGDGQLHRRARLGR